MNADGWESRSLNDFPDLHRIEPRWKPHGDGSVGRQASTRDDSCANRTTCDPDAELHNKQPAGLLLHHEQVMRHHSGLVLQSALNNKNSHTLVWWHHTPQGRRPRSYS